MSFEHALYRARCIKSAQNMNKIFVETKLIITKTVRGNKTDRKRERN